MSFNPTFSYTPARQLIIPNTGTEGWKTLGTIYNGVAGYMSWKDKQKQAERLQKAQDDYYEILKSYLNKKEEDILDCTSKSRCNINILSYDNKLHIITPFIFPYTKMYMC